MIATSRKMKTGIPPMLRFSKLHQRRRKTTTPTTAQRSVTKTQAKGNESPDIIFVPDADPLSLDSVDTKAQAGVAVAPTPTHVGTVVVIDDAAFVTWVCFLL